MKITKERKVDKRIKIARYIKQNKQVLKAMLVLGILFALIFTPVVYKWLNPPMLSPLGQAIDNKVVVNAGTDKYQERGYAFCYDPLICIRDVGEEMGFDNKQILIAIRIAKAESSLRPDAIGKNTNGTYDMGVFQINDVHSKKISRVDRLDFVKNIDFAWDLKIKQGFNPWSVCKNGKVNCY